MIPSESDARTANNGVRHGYRELSAEEKQHMVDVKDLGAAFLTKLSALPQGRETALARTKIEEAVMWAVKGLTA